MPVRHLKVHTWCDQCGMAIYKGDEMWFKGSERYCYIRCLIASFNVKKPEFDERDLLLREKRVDMMQEIYKKRKRPFADGR